MSNANAVDSKPLPTSEFLSAMTNGIYFTIENIRYSFADANELGYDVAFDQYVESSITGLLDKAQQTSNFEDITQNERFTSAYKAAMQAISSVTNLSFEASENTTDVNLIIAQTDGIRDKDTLALSNGIGSYLSANNSHAFSVVANGWKNYWDPVDDGGNHLGWVAIHELLHTVGLYHPMDTHHQTTLLDPRLDHVRYTAMSYNNVLPSGYLIGDNNAGYAVTLMPLDIAAMQFLYGANENYGAMTDYNWIGSGSKIDLLGDDGQVSVGRALYTIWDTGGEDTINFSNANDDALINLNGAKLTFTISSDAIDMRTALTSSTQWSGLSDFVKSEVNSDAAFFGGYISTTFGSGINPGGYVISNGYHLESRSIIENAVGGTGNDVLIGNEARNYLFGGDGNDLIFGGNGDDVIYGGRGQNELRGGKGADLVFGDKDKDLIWFGPDGDQVFGGEDDDTFVMDSMIDSSGSAIVNGGAGHDIIKVYGGYLDTISGNWALQLASTGSKIGNINVSGVEILQILDASGNQTQTYDLATFSADFFTNKLSGLPSPNTTGTVNKAALTDNDPNDTVVYKADIPFSNNLDITGYSGSFGYNGQNYDLVMSVSHWADTITVTLSLPAGFEYDLDAHQKASFVQENNFQIDYEYTEAVITDDGVIEYIIPATKYYTSFTGVQNSYDNGLTQIVGPDVVYADRWLYDQSTGSTEIAFSHDSIEPGKPVRYWLSNDTSGLLQIDSETGAVTTRSNLFRDGQTVHATIVASDGISEVTKDIEVRLDTSVETAPLFLATNELSEVLPVIGSGAGTFDWADDNYGEKWRFAVEVVGATASNPLFKISPDGMPGFVIARAPTAAEIGVTHQVKITITDDTGQSDTAFMNVHIDPLEGVMDGTSGDDYLMPPAWSERIWTIKGGEGNDDLDTGYLNNRISKTTLNGGDGDDMLSLNASHTVGNGDAGDDNIFVYADNTKANGGSGNDTINSWGFDTLINGDDGDDIISAYYDRATINGGAGDDTITFYGADATVDGGSGNDVIHSFGQGMITGGAGADTIYTLNDTIVFKELGDSYLDNISLTGNSGPSGLWDTIFGVNDDTIIDLSALGEIEWAGSSTSSTSMLATMIQGDNPGDAFFAIDANRDGGFDFGIQLHNIQAANAIHFNGLSDWLV